MSNWFFVFFYFLLLLCPECYAQKETKENDLLEALSFEGFHWKGNDGFHDPSTLFERSELAFIPPWKPIPNDLPKHLLPHSPPFLNPSTTPTPSPTPQVNEESLQDTRERKETGSKVETGEVPPWFNRFEFLDFRSWFFKQALFKDLDLPSSLASPLIRCCANLSQPPPPHLSSSPSSSSTSPFWSPHPWWQPFDTNKFYSCVLSSISSSSSSSSSSPSTKDHLRSIGFQEAATLSRQTARFTRTLQTMNTCLDIRKWLPVETILTRTSSLLIQNEGLVSEEKNQPKEGEVLKKAFPFPSFSPLLKGDLHSDFWPYLPGDSKEVRRVIRGSCAIVSSSSILLQHEKGAEIDSHHTVIRFNGNPTKGYEKHVGRKTTLRASSGAVVARYWNKTNAHEYQGLFSEVSAHWLTSSEPEQFERAARRLIQLLEQYSRPYARVQKKRREGTQIDRQDDSTLPLANTEEKTEEGEVFLFLSSQRSTSFLRMCLNALTPFQSSEAIQPTAGIEVILQVLPYCDTVSLYGFSWKNSKGEPESHYYSNKRVSDLKWQVERRFIQVLAIQGLVNISI